MPKEKKKKKRSQIEDLMSERGDLIPYLYLLNEILNVYFEVPSNGKLEEEDAEKKLVHMLIQIMAGLIEKTQQKLLLVFDEAQNLCTKDWKILKQI